MLAEPVVISHKVVSRVLAQAKHLCKILSIKQAFEFGYKCTFLSAISNLSPLEYLNSGCGTNSPPEEKLQIAGWGSSIPSPGVAAAMMMKKKKKKRRGVVELSEENG
jgi:hypothetical protein